MREKGNRRKKKKPFIRLWKPCVSSCFFVYSDDGGEEEVCGLVMNRESERKLLGKIGRNTNGGFNQSGAM